jgi:magnesium transporter
MRVLIWQGIWQTYGPHYMLIAITIFLSLIGVVLWGTISGALLPMILRRAGFDPATASTPFVATMVDVTGLVIYFNIALVVLHGTLLK